LFKKISWLQFFVLILKNPTDNMRYIKFQYI
jgi:hypothetical protein